MSCELEVNSWDKIAISRHDHQERKSLVIQLKKYFTFEVQVLDDKNVRRRFRASNYQSTTRVKPFICTMPMRLDEGKLLVYLRLESNPVQFIRLYTKSIRFQLH